MTAVHRIIQHMPNVVPSNCFACPYHSFASAESAWCGLLGLEEVEQRNRKRYEPQHGKRSLLTVAACTPLCTVQDWQEQAARDLQGATT